MDGNTILQIMIGIIAIGLFYWSRFNSWTEREAKFGKTRPPRQFTTWARYTLYAFLYTLTVEVFYLVLVYSPDILFFLSKQFNMTLPEAATGDKQLPLWILAVLLGFFPHLPGFRQAEEVYRAWLHQRAFIPAEAKALINHLMSDPELFKPDEETVEKVMKEYSSSLPEGWVYRPDEDGLTERWFRLAYLKEKLDRWCAQPRIERFVSHGEDERRLFLEQFSQLNLDVEAYINKSFETQDQPGSGESADVVNPLKGALVRQIEKLQTQVFECIACGVLTTEKSHDRRMADLNFFGLFPDYKPGIPIVLDIVLLISVFTLGIVTLTSTVYQVYNQRVYHRPFTFVTSLQWAVVALLMIGLSIFFAVVLYRMLTLKSRFKEDSDGATLVMGPFVHQVIGFAAGYLSGLSIIFLFIQLKRSHAGVWINLLGSLPWPLVPAIISGFVVYYLATLAQERSRIKDAVTLGLCTGLAGLISGFWAFGTAQGKLPLHIFLAVSCGSIGSVIGYIFPHAYRRYHQRTVAVYSGDERRQGKRVKRAVKGMLSYRGETAPCETLDISNGGARLVAAGNAGIGDTVQLALPGMGIRESQVVRKQGKHTAVRFQPALDLDGAMKDNKGVVAG